MFIYIYRGERQREREREIERHSERGREKYIDRREREIYIYTEETRRNEGRKEEI